MKTTKPALTHSQAIRAFPILSLPFKPTTKAHRPGMHEDRIIDSEEFLRECETHGSGALWCGKLVLSLAGFFIPSEYGELDLYKFFGGVDSQHKKAAVALFRAVAERGIK